MVFRVEILVKDPEPVFEWTKNNVLASGLVRQIPESVNYEAVKARVCISICSPGHPHFGWLAQVFVKDLEIANVILSTWEPQVELCRVITIGQ
jgi:hypothetical protein